MSQPTPRDVLFKTLADPTRRGVLERLGRADASISELAGQFQMTLTGMKKHVSILEQTGLVITEKVGRVRTCRIGPRRMEEEAAWLEHYRKIVEENYQRLDALLDDDVTEVYVNSDRKVWKETYSAGPTFTECLLEADFATMFLNAVATRHRVTLDRDHPAISAELPDQFFNRARLQGEVPPLVEHPSFNIRKPPPRTFTLPELVAQVDGWDVEPPEAG